MTTLVDLSPADRALLARMDTHQITEQPGPGEYGYHTWSRKTAQAVCQAIGGTAWRAEARTPYMPHPLTETHAQLAITVDLRWLIVWTHTVPAGTAADLFTIKINGRAIPYETFRGELPHDPAIIARAAWRHVTGVRTGECDALLCTDRPTVAGYGGANMCATHAREYVNGRRW